MIISKRFKIVYRFRDITLIFFISNMMLSHYTLFLTSITPHIFCAFAKHHDGFLCFALK